MMKGFVYVSERDFWFLFFKFCLLVSVVVEENVNVC